MKDLRQNYRKFEQKYKLPSFEELDKEFEILYVHSIFEISYPLKFIRRRINDNISWICNMIQTIMQPNPGSIISMEESTFFPKENKEGYQKLLKELMYIERLSLALDIESTEENDAELIKTMFNKWKEIKPKVHEITNILKEGWKKEAVKENRNHSYLG